MQYRNPKHGPKAQIRGKEIVGRARRLPGFSVPRSQVVLGNASISAVRLPLPETITRVANACRSTASGTRAFPSATWERGETRIAKSETRTKGSNQGERDCRAGASPAWILEWQPTRLPYNSVLVISQVEDSNLFETHSLPALSRCYPRSFAFYVAHPTRSIRISIFGFRVSASSVGRGRVTVLSLATGLPSSSARFPAKPHCARSGPGGQNYPPGSLPGG